MFAKLIICICLILLVSSSEVGKQKSLAVTIYNNDFAMVKDVREFKFDQGQSNIYFTDVSANIQTETVTFKAVKNPESIRVYEQNFQKNLVNKFAILEKYIDKEIEIYAVIGQASRRVIGTLLGYNSGFIMKTAQGVDIYDNVVGIDLPSLPDGFYTKPTLNWRIFSKSALNTDCQVAYRTTGFGWKSDYLLSLNEQQTKADISGWVTIDNNSGKRYQNTKLKLVAGDVNTVQNVQPIAFRGNFAVADSLSAAPSFSEKSFSDYHLYTLSQTVTVDDASQKQVEFIPKAYDVKIRRYYIIQIGAGGYSQEKLQTQSKIDFNNNKNQGLGIPLPKGTFRVFKRDQADGSLQFIGEDSINHTPVDQTITLSTGNAFDIVADKYAESRNSYQTGAYDAVMNVTISNKKETSAEFEVRFANYYGDNLKVTPTSLSPSIKFSKYSANEYRWAFVLPAGAKVILEWNENYKV